MALTMNSPLGFFSPAAKLRHYSRSSWGPNQHSICAKPLMEKIYFVEVPALVSRTTRGSIKDIRLGRILLAADSNKIAAESGVTETRDTKAADPNDQLLSSDIKPEANSSGTIPPQKQDAMPKKSLTARERLRAARVLSRYTESKPPKPEPGKRILEAIRESDKGKKRSGLPEAPENLFDDSKRGMPKAGLTFNLPVGGDLLVIILSFVTITTIMFATTYVVWKLGAIHFNEY